MNIILTSDSGKFMVNSDTVRMYVPMHKGGTSLFFMTGHRVEVQESLDEIYEKLLVNQQVVNG